MNGDGSKVRASRLRTDTRGESARARQPSMVPGIVAIAMIALLTIGLGLHLTSADHTGTRDQTDPIEDEVTTFLKVGPATFFLSVGTDVADPMEYERIAKHICKKRSNYGIDGCVVGIWDDDKKMGKQLPMSLEQASAQLYSWSLGRSLWNCERFPRMNRDRCFSE